MKKRLSQEWILLIIFAIVFAIMSVISPDKFFSVQNLRSMCFQVPEFGLFALAMMVTILTGGINLSVITSGTLGGVLGAMVLSTLWANGTGNILSIAISVVVVLGVSTLCGFINGSVVSYVGTAAMMTTLGTSTLYEGIGLLVSKGNSISKFPTEFYWFGNKTIIGIPVPMVIFLVMATVVYLLLERSSWGMNVYMVGSNPKTSMYSGINVRKTMLLSYVLSGFLSGMAMVIMMSRYNSARIDYGSSYLMQSVAAAVLGGTLITGGYGRVMGIVISVLLMQSVSSGLTILGMDNALTTMVTGLVLLGVLTINFINRSRNGRLHKVIMALQTKQSFIRRSRGGEGADKRKNKIFRREIP